MNALGRLIRWLFGDFEADMTEYGRHEGYLCPDCKVPHWVRAGCPRAMTGECVNCNRTRQLDRFGNCMTCGSRQILFRRMPGRPRLRLVVPRKP